MNARMPSSLSFVEPPTPNAAGRGWARAEAGEDADVDLGLPDLRLGGGEREGAGEGGLRSPAEGEAVDRGEDRLVARRDRVPKSAAQVREGAHLEGRQPDHLLDVRARDKGAIPGPG